MFAHAFQKLISKLLIEYKVVLQILEFNRLIPEIDVLRSFYVQMWETIFNLKKNSRDKQELPVKDLKQNLFAMSILVPDFLVNFIYSW